MLVHTESDTGETHEPSSRRFPKRPSEAGREGAWQRRRIGKKRRRKGRRRPRGVRRVLRERKRDGEPTKRCKDERPGDEEEEKGQRPIDLRGSGQSLGSGPASSAFTDKDRRREKDRHLRARTSPSPSSLCRNVGTDR